MIRLTRIYKIKNIIKLNLIIESLYYIIYFKLKIYLNMDFFLKKNKTKIF